MSSAAALATVMREIAALKSDLAEREAMLPALKQKAFDEAVAAAAAAAARVDELSAEIKPVAKPVAKAKSRTLTQLLECLPIFSAVYLESLGDRWTARFARNADGHLGFYSEQEVFYTSPDAFSKAHASRITEAHPNPTKHGNGWEHIRVGDGLSKGKSIGNLLNEYRAAH